MTLTVTLILLAAAALLLPRLASFAAKTPEDYAETTPRMDITRHLSGPIISEGVIYGPFGKVAARFVAHMQGEWGEGVGTLTEEFAYAGGGTLHREWTIQPGPNGAFTATAPDIIGEAEGQTAGATARMKYRIRLEPEAGGHILDVTDWLYLMENGTMMNRSEFRKFGFKVGELVATMRPATDAMMKAAE